VVTVVSEVVNSFRLKGMNHRQFKNFLRDVESECGNVLCDTEVLWLSRVRLLKRVYELKSEIELFLDIERKYFPHFCDHDWMCDFAFSIDII
jgi:hypothetical protein